MELFDSIYLSEYSFGRLPVIFYSIVICIFLFFHPSKSLQSKIAGTYFLFINIFHFGFLIAYSLHHPLGSLGYYFTATSPIGISILLLFAYLFPRDTLPLERKKVFKLFFLLSTLICFEYFYKAYNSNVKIFTTGYGSVYVSIFVPIINVFLFLWTTIVLFRKAVYHSKTFYANSEKGLYYLFFPGGKEALYSRNLALVVLCEFINSIFLTSGVLLKAFTYTQISIWMNFSFLVIYSLYIILFLRYYNGSTPVSFKLINFSLLCFLVFLIIFGNIYIHFLKQYFHERRLLEINSFLKINHKDKTKEETISGLEFLIEWKSDESKKIIFLNENYSLPQNLNIWDRVPSLLEYERRPNFLNFSELINYNQKELYFRSNNKNIQLIPVIFSDKIYLFGFDYFQFRKYIHPPIKILLSLFIYIILINFILLPIVLSKHFSQPIKELLLSLYENQYPLLLTSKKKDWNNEIEILQDAIQVLKDNIGKSNEISSIIDYDEEQFEVKNEFLEEEKEKFILNSKNLEKVKMVQDYISLNYNFELSREGLASLVNLSAGRLGKYFKKATGFKINEYTNKLRIDKASQLLLETNKTVLEIAYEVGFESLRTFNRVFILEKKMNPIKFRNSRDSKT
jgi:AraC-like DNA-binding protein